MCVLLPIKYFDNTPKQSVVLDAVDNIKSTIQYMLFDKNYDSVLINFKNQLYVCDVINRIERKYTKCKVNYHPLQKNLVPNI
jgi:hypothetical protein